MLLVKFLKKHWLSSGDLKFCTAGEHEWRGVGQRHRYFIVGGAQWIFCILKQNKKKVEKPKKLRLPLKRSCQEVEGRSILITVFSYANIWDIKSCVCVLLKALLDCGAGLGDFSTAVLIYFC